MDRAVPRYVRLDAIELAATKMVGYFEGVNGEDFTEGTESLMVSANLVRELVLAVNMPQQHPKENA